jgi:DNA invertase Pin-like site-specific DNA recombinase
MSSLMKNISIPVDKVEAVRQFLNQLNMSEEKEEKEEKCVEIKKIESVVHSVVDHRKIYNEWEFNLKFKDGSLEWVKDSSTECEIIISKYLHNKGIKTVYCFCRVSTKRQVGDTHISLEAQESELISACEIHIENKRIKVIKISGSAYSQIPLALKKIGESVSSGDVILVYRVDRLSRNIVKYLSWLEDLDKRDVVIRSISDNIYYRSDKLKFIQGILDANKESVLIGSRVKMSVKRRRERGDECLGGLSYGKRYQRIQDGKLKVVPDMSEQFIIDKLKNMSRDQKYTHDRSRLDIETRQTYVVVRRSVGQVCEIIAKKLNDDGFLKKNRKWNGGMVKRLLK